MCVSLMFFLLPDVLALGDPRCWDGKHTYVTCCQINPTLDCFDETYTYETCCKTEDFARTFMANFIAGMALVKKVEQKACDLHGLAVHDL